ncbi:MAG: LysM domain-containing protein, partial [Desulfobacterales bacterium]|nr:LysM domain-containing protein [Desulfobacterales bacterium]
MLMVGQKICIPLPIPEIPECQNGNLYMIKKGETLNSVSDKFKISLNTLLNANPQIEDSEIIFPGQIICIPAQNNNS